jgi:hypothetical protein
MIVAFVSCFSCCCFYVNCLSIYTSLWFDRRHVLLTCLLLYVVRTSILFSATVSLILRLLYLFSVYANVISDVSYIVPVGYKSREVFLSLCFFCTAYRAATTVTTILHKYIELICEPPFQLNLLTYLLDILSSQLHIKL